MMVYDMCILSVERPLALRPPISTGHSNRSVHPAPRLRATSTISDDASLATPYLLGQWPRRDNSSPSMFDECTQTPLLWEQQQQQSHRLCRTTVDGMVTELSPPHRRSRSVDHGDNLRSSSEVSTVIVAQYICQSITACLQLAMIMLGCAIVSLV